MGAVLDFKWLKTSLAKQIRGSEGTPIKSGGKLWIF
jgi:hypothetical protein